MGIGDARRCSKRFECTKFWIAVPQPPFLPEDGIESRPPKPTRGKRRAGAPPEMGQGRLEEIFHSLQEKFHSMEPGFHRMEEMFQEQ